MFAEKVYVLSKATLLVTRIAPGSWKIGIFVSNVLLAQA